MNSDDRSGVRDKVSLQARQGRFMVLYTIKKITLLLLLILLGSAVSMAQTYELWGTTTGGGQNGKGTIFKTDGAGNNHQVIHDFSVGQYPTGFLLLASDGIIYGTTRFGGDSTNYGTIFSIDPKNGQFTKLYDFVKKNGLQPHGNLVEGASGILYGTAAGGSSGDGGVIFSYNPANGTYTKLYSFGTGKDGKNPTTGLELAWDGKYYGATKFGGKNNQGVIYSFDAATNVYSKRLDLSHSKTGTGPSGKLVQGFQGNKDLLYGVNHNGGTSNLGTLFILNLKKNTLTVKHNFTNKSGSAPYGPILETTNGIVYGMTHRGGKYDKGVIYRYGYYLNDYKVKHNFNDTHGRAPSGGFILASNGKLYGLTYGSNVKPAVNGTLIEYDTLTNTVTKKVEFSGINGFRPRGNLIEIESCVDFETLTVSACDSYTSPSGNYTWNTSGTYMDTLTNAAGCDSILTIDLTVHYTTYSSFSELVCDTYISPSGQVWTVSGQYMDVIPNAGGCDSIMTIDLTVNSFQTRSFTLVSSVTNMDIDSLYDGYVIDRSVVGPFSVVANVCQPNNIHLMEFEVNGKHFKNINKPPYALNGSNGKGYKAWTVAPGSYVITATPRALGQYVGHPTIGASVDIIVVDPYWVNKGKGKKNNALEENVGTGLSIYPNPGYDYVTIESKHPIQIFNISGQLIYHGVAGRIDVAEWPDGLYLVKTPYTTKWLQVQ